MSSFLKTVLGASAALCVGAVVATQMMDRSTHAGKAPQAARLTASGSGRSATASPPASFGAVTLEQGAGGHYVANVEVNGRRAAMMVDTGASIIALTDEDARSMGVGPRAADYIAPMSTANGTIKAAPVMLREVRIGSISVRDVQAVVMPRGAMRQSLLGMSFLGRLRGYEVASGRLVLRQ